MDGANPDLTFAKQEVKRQSLTTVINLILTPPNMLTHYQPASFCRLTCNLRILTVIYSHQKTTQHTIPSFRSEQ
jgi:hypothetical protein